VSDSSAPRWRGRAGVAALGVLPALAFPEANLMALAPLGLAAIAVVLACAVTHREAIVRAWFAGIGYFVIVGQWLIPNVGPGLLVFAALLAVTWIPFGATVRWGLTGTPSRVAVTLVAAPAAFVAGEYVRSWEYLGGPWALMGASLWSRPGLLAPAAVGGVWFLSAGVVVVAVASAAFFVPGTITTRMVGGLGLAAATAIWLGAAVLSPAEPAKDTLVVGGVQPGPDLGAEERFRRALGATAELAVRAPDLVVWGESSVGFDIADPGVLEKIVAASNAAGAPVLVNVDARRGRGGIFKSSVLVDGNGVAGRYDKVRLVPFGEYVPLRPVLGWVSALSEAAVEDRRRGSGPVLLAAGRTSIGPLVCFESSFPDMARTLAAVGADVIVVQSSTSTFQETWAPEQHASLGAIRAAETGRPVVHATLTGTSAAFDLSGRRLAWVSTERRGSYVVEVPLSTVLTPYVRYGDWFPRACAAGTVLWWVAAGRRRRVQNSATVGPTDSPRRAVEPRMSRDS
jgi:apolipoprotein N-acyltransferase